MTILPFGSRWSRSDVTRSGSVTVLLTALERTKRGAFCGRQGPFEATRALHDLSLLSWKLNGLEQVLDEEVYLRAVVDSMNVGSLADVIMILNLIVFMFEDRGSLMWSKPVQRNALRALFMAPAEANLIAEKAQAVTAANSAYRNLLYIVNRDSKQLIRDRPRLRS